ncbi:hypothetical protein M2161_003564 [Streptomyces sp. SAI-133]|nr:hypothetical protein [Streptomyces sp. SAI-133]
MPRRPTSPPPASPGSPWRRPSTRTPPLRLAWEQPDRELHLPTLGTLTLPAPGRVEAVVSARGLDVRTADGTCLSAGDQPSAAWRPLTVLKVAAAEPLLIDDADPRRAVYPAPVTDPLDPAGLSAFRERLRTAYELRAEQGAGTDDDRNALRVDAVTPLVAGAGVRLAGDGLGGLGVAVDFEPAAFVRELPRLGRRARLAALRATTDLHVPGNQAGRLLTEAVEGLSDVAYWGRETPQGLQALARAGHALTSLSELPDRDLTESGEVLAGELRAEWTTIAERP